MKNNIENLINELKSFQENGTIKDYKKLLDICDVLLDKFPNELRKEPFYSFSLDIINELMSLRIGIGSNKMYDGTDLDLEIIIKQMKLLKSVVPSDEKMQKVINRLFRG